MGWRPRLCELMQQIEILLQKGRALQDEGRYEGAITAFEDILRQYPSHAEANFLVGLVADQMGNSEVALRFLLRATTEAPDLPSPLNALAETYLKLRHYAEAERCYADIAHRLLPDNVEIHRSLGQMRRILLRVDDSIAAYEKAIELDPKSATSWLELAATLSVSYTRFDERDKVLRRASELGWDDFDVVCGVGRRHLLEGQYEEAERHFRRAGALVEGKSVSPIFHYERAIALQALGRGADADAELEVALEIGMGVFRTGKTLVELCELAGILVFELAAFCVPVLLALGRRDEAIQTAQRIARQGPPSTFSFSESIYLTNPLKRIERFESVVAGRDVAILLQGPSIRQLEERIGELAGEDICYASLNQFPQIDERVLSKIGERLDVVMVGNPLSFVKHEEQVYEFLARDENNMLAGTDFMTTTVDVNKFGGKTFRERFDSKLIYFDCQHYYPPTLIRPLHFSSGNTLSVLIPFLLLAKPRRIFIFGSDGGGDPTSNDGAYFFSKSPGDKTERNRVAETYRRLRLDARHCDQNVEASMIMISVLYSVPIPEIYNVCLDSANRAFPRISYDDAFEMLKA